MITSLEQADELARVDPSGLAGETYSGPKNETAGGAIAVVVIFGVALWLVFGAVGDRR